MRGVINHQGGAVTLRLSPPEMGVVRIELQVNHGTVNAQLHAEHESARTLLNQQLSQLRQALETQGLTVDRLLVQTLATSDNAPLTPDRDGDQTNHDGRSRGQHPGGNTGGQDRGDGQPREGSNDEARPDRLTRLFDQMLKLFG